MRHVTWRGACMVAAGAGAAGAGAAGAEAPCIRRTLSTMVWLYALVPYLPTPPVALYPSRSIPLGPYLAAPPVALYPSRSIPLGPYLAAPLPPVALNPKPQTLNPYLAAPPPPVALYPSRSLPPARPPSLAPSRSPSLSSLPPSPTFPLSKQMIIKQSNKLSGIGGGLKRMSNLAGSEGGQMAGGGLKRMSRTDSHELLSVMTSGRVNHQNVLMGKGNSTLDLAWAKMTG